MTISNLAVERLKDIPRWAFWREKERKFWFGAILADYARITGSELADKRADEIFDETASYMQRKFGAVNKST